MKRRFLLLGIGGALVLLLVSGYFFLHPSALPSLSREDLFPRISSAVSPNAQTGSAVSSALPPATPRLKSFLGEEGESFDTGKVDAAAAEKHVKEMAAQLTPEEMKFLVATALEMNARASDRILSAYLLVSAKEKAFSSLRDFITAPLRGNPHAPEHSVEELAAMQEKSLRVMAIDGLFEQAKVDPAARDTFFKLVSELREPSLSQYVQKKIKELSTM